MTARPEKVGPGDVVLAASNALHGLKNVGDSTGMYFVVAIGRPTAFELMFQGMRLRRTRSTSGNKRRLVPPPSWLQFRPRLSDSSFAVLGAGLLSHR